jgi:hypothetical protein
MILINRYKNKLTSMCTLKLNFRRISLLFSLFFFHQYAYSWSLFGAKNYDECILENMKNVKTDSAANAVAYACASKFPSELPTDKPKKLRCNGKEIDPNEFSEVQFPVPNDFGTLKIVKLAWEPIYQYSNQNIFKTYIQHSYPFSIKGFYLQGYTAKNVEDVAYWCGGDIAPNAVGTAICQNVQSSSKTFNVKTVITPRMSVYELLKSINKCS